MADIWQIYGRYMAYVWHTYGIEAPDISAGVQYPCRSGSKKIKEITKTVEIAVLILHHAWCSITLTNTDPKCNIPDNLHEMLRAEECGCDRLNSRKWKV